MRRDSIMAIIQATKKHLETTHDAIRRLEASIKNARKRLEEEETMKASKQCSLAERNDMSSNDDFSSHASHEKLPDDLFDLTRGGLTKLENCIQAFKE